MLMYGQTDEEEAVEDVYDEISGKLYMRAII
jgi:hypothetical protein